MRKILPVFLSLCLLPAFGADRAAPAVTAGPEPGYEYFRPADFMRPLISPGGKSVGFVARTNKHTKLYQLDLATGQLEGIYDPGDGDIDDYWWITDTRLLISGYGKEGLIYFSYDMGTGKSNKLPWLSHQDGSTLRFLPGLKNKVVASLSEETGVVRNNSFYSNYLAAIDLDTGRQKRLTSLHGDADNAILSPDGDLLSEVWMDGATWHVRWRASVKSAWQEIEGTDTFPTIRPIALSADDRQFLVLATDQGDTSALMALDLATGRRTLLGQRSTRDVAWVTMMGTTQSVYSVSFKSEGDEDVMIFDPALRDFHRQLKLSLPGKNSRIIDSSIDGQVRVIANWDASHPFVFYLYANNRLAFLGRERDALKGDNLGRLVNFTYKTRDGLEESGFVVLPPKGSGPFPLVVIAPGMVGEPAPTGLSYDSEAQYLASRGYAVAKFVSRGHVGFGQKFAAAGDFALSDRVVEDVEDGIHYLVTQGTADPGRVAMYGYGRHALLALYAAKKGSPYRAVVVEDPSKAPTATSIGWQSSHRLAAAEIVKQAGGVSAAYLMMKKFDPVASVPAMEAAVLLVGPRITDSVAVEDALQKHKKVFEWYHPNREYPGMVRTKVYFLTWKKIADFLDAQLGASIP